MVGIVGIQFAGGTYEAAFPIYQSLLKTRDKQVAAFEKRPSIAGDIADFKDPAFVDRIIRRFPILKDTEDFETGLGYSASAPNAFALRLFQGGARGGINLLV